MRSGNSLQYWEVWYPKAASTGILLARGMVESTSSLLVHAAPDVVTVEVSDTNGNRLAYGQDLERTQESPICRLRIEQNRVTREDCWPTEEDLDSPVLLPGGEVGALKSWWNAADKKAGAGKWNFTIRCGSSYFSSHPHLEVHEYQQGRNFSATETLLSILGAGDNFDASMGP